MRVYEWFNTSTGFRITKNGRVIIDQPFYPDGSPDVAISNEDREPMALSIIAELEAQDEQMSPQGEI